MSHNINKDRLYFTDKQRIELKKFQHKGLILDIGGGGEGVIGQLFGDKVIAIDPSERELMGAAPGPLKIVMDARELKFLDNQFNIATSFFTLMYIKKKDIEKVFKEVYRVLRNDGEFLIWDVNIPNYDGGKKDIYVIPLEIYIDGREKAIETGYGTRWEGGEQNIQSFIELGKKSGFEVVEEQNYGETFFIKLKK